MKHLNNIAQWFFIWVLGCVIVFAAHEVKILKEVVTIQSHTINVLIDIAKAQTK